MFLYFKEYWPCFGTLLSIDKYCTVSMITVVGSIFSHPIITGNTVDIVQSGFQLNHIGAQTMNILMSEFRQVTQISKINSQ